jgi:hypothetical protein
MIDITRFHKNNIIDTCSVWNLLSSRKFYQAALNAGCDFTCSRFVIYECLYKTRKSLCKEDLDLQERLRSEQRKGYFKEEHISIDELQQVDVLEKCMSLSKGELSSIVLAKSRKRAFLTDDQPARKLACNFLNDEYVQTTPQLFGWLYFEGMLADSDKDQIISEHREMNRPLGTYFNKVYLWALELKLAKNVTESNL